MASVFCPICGKSTRNGDVVKVGPPTNLRIHAGSCFRTWDAQWNAGTTQWQQDNPDFEEEDDEEEEEVKSIEREDGSVVRDLTEVDLDENMSAIARAVRGPVAARATGPGLLERVRDSLPAVLKKPVVYIPLGLGAAYLLYRMFRPSNQQVGHGPAVNHARNAMSQRMAADAQANEEQDPQRAMQAAAEAEAAIAEMDAQAAAMGEPQQPQEDDDRPNIVSYVN